MCRAEAAAARANGTASRARAIASSSTAAVRAAATAMTLLSARRKTSTCTTRRLRADRALSFALNVDAAGGSCTLFQTFDSISILPVYIYDTLFFLSLRLLRLVTTIYAHWIERRYYRWLLLEVGWVEEDGGSRLMRCGEGTSCRTLFSDDESMIRMTRA